MDIFASREQIRASAREAADRFRDAQGLQPNPWPEGTDAHALWWLERKRYEVELYGDYITAVYVVAAPA